MARVEHPLWSKNQPLFVHVSYETRLQKMTIFCDAEILIGIPKRGEK